MASICDDPGGRRRILFIDGTRKSIRLGKVSKREAEEVKNKVEASIAAKTMGVSIDGETARWFAGISDKLHRKLAAKGLVSSRQPAESPKQSGVGDWIETYIAGRTDAKPRTVLNMRAARNYLVAFFGVDRLMQKITPADADRFAIYLKGKYSEATAARGIKRARQFFHAACRALLLAENPFEGVKVGAMDNPDRLHFVTSESTEKILEACPDAEWRALVALCRYGGLRCPSEPLQLTWADIDWHAGRFLVRSPKMEHTKNKGRRMVPLFPELRVHLEALFDQAPTGSTHVITRTRNGSVNLRTHFERIIERAGLLPWPRLFQNLRASRQTELAARFPIHVVCQWIGNSAAIAEKHYLKVTESDFELATGKSGAESGAQAAQNRAQQAAAFSRTDTQGAQELPRNQGFLQEFTGNQQGAEYPRQESNLHRLA
jgi:integrase